MQIWITERSHRCDGGKIPSSGKVPKFSATVDSFPSRYIISGATQGLPKFSRPQSKRGGENS